MGKSRLEGILKCSILSYVVVREHPTPAYKIKIPNHHLYNAIRNARSNQCYADIWLNGKVPINRAVSGLTGHMASGTSVGGTPMPVKVTSWNCRGVSTAIPYLTDRILADSSVVVVSEHWLWPYELYKLDEIHPDFRGHGQSDARLTESADGGRGFGGVVFFGTKVWK